MKRARHAQSRAREAQRALEPSPLPAMLVAKDGALVFANRAARERLHGAAAEAPARPRVRADLAKRLLASPAGEAHARLVSGGAAETCVMTWERAQGPVTMRLTGAPFAMDARSSGSLWFFEELAATEVPQSVHPDDALLQHIVDAIPAPIFYKDAEGRYRGGNVAFADYLGVPLTKIVGRTVFEVAPADLASVYHEADLALMRAGGFQRYETQVKNADGSRRDVLFTKATFTANDKTGLVGTILDITDRKAVERLAAAQATEAQEAERALRGLLDALPDAVVLYQEERIAHANKAARSLAKSHVEALVELSRAKPGEDAPSFHEVRLANADGSVVVLEVRFVPLPLGGRAGRAIVARDVTERRSVEATMALTDRLASVGTLAAGVAHEINNPLTYVSTNIEFVLEQLALDERPSPEVKDEMVAALTEANTGVSRAVDIVRDLRTFARDTPPAREAVNVAEVVKKAVRLASSELRQHASVRVEIEPDCSVMADGVRAAQVLLNILLNAAHAISSSAKRPGTIVVSAQRRGERVRVDVTDSGVGIPEKLVPRVFDPFFTTKPVGEGTGLGLALCHALVKQMGGTITLTSVVGEGTTVSVELDAAAPVTP